MRERFEAVIERATGRPGDRVDERQPAAADMMCEVFILGPSDLVDEHEMPDPSGRSGLIA